MQRNRVQPDAGSPNSPGTSAPGNSFTKVKKRIFIDNASSQGSDSNGAHSYMKPRSYAARAAAGELEGDGPQPQFGRRRRAPSTGTLSFSSKGSSSEDGSAHNGSMYYVARSPARSSEGYTPPAARRNSFSRMLRRSSLSSISSAESGNGPPPNRGRHGSSAGLESTPSLTRRSSTFSSMDDPRVRSLRNRPLLVRLWLALLAYLADQGSQRAGQLISLLFLCMPDRKARSLDRRGVAGCHPPSTCGGSLDLPLTRAGPASAVLVPYQVAFEERVVFSGWYALGYGLDFAMVLCRLPPAAVACRQALTLDHADYRRKASRWRALRGAAHLALVLPYDLTLWSTAHQPAVPWLRLTRLVFAPAQVRWLPPLISP